MASTSIPSTQAEAPPEWSLESARELYNIDGWGAGYFDINSAGHVIVRPDRERPECELDLFELATDLEEQGVALPVLLRFSDILRSRVRQLNERFVAAREEYGYTGGYTSVYPIKVNQQRHVIEEIANSGREYGVGLECGSNPQPQAVLALDANTDNLIICNGYKDHESIRLALMRQKHWDPVLVALEQVRELDVRVDVADELCVSPTAGVRSKAASAGFGRGAQSGAGLSRCGVSTSRLMVLVDRRRDLGRLEFLKL